MNNCRGKHVRRQFSLEQQGFTCPNWQLILSMQLAVLVLLSTAVFDEAKLEWLVTTVKAQSTQLKEQALQIVANGDELAILRAQGRSVDSRMQTGRQLQSTDPPPLPPSSPPLPLCTSGNGGEDCRTMWHESILHQFEVPASAGCGLEAELHSATEPLTVRRDRGGNLTMEYRAGVAFSTPAPFTLTHHSGCASRTLSLQLNTVALGSLTVNGVDVGAALTILLSPSPPPPPLPLAFAVYNPDATATYSLPPGTSHMHILLIGGGGGGGNGHQNGGGSGFLQACDLGSLAEGTILTIIVGAGGTAPSDPSSGSPPGKGGTSSVSCSSCPTCSAMGGEGFSGGSVGGSGGGGSGNGGYGGSGGSNGGNGSPGNTASGANGQGGWSSMLSAALPNIYGLSAGAAGVPSDSCTHCGGGGGGGLAATQTPPFTVAAPGLSPAYANIVNPNAPATTGAGFGGGGGGGGYDGSTGVYASGQAGLPGLVYLYAT